MTVPATDTPPPERRPRCGRCSAAYESAQFAALAPVRRLVGAELAEHVVHWPDGVFVDVRECARCQAPIARLSREPR